MEKKKKDNEKELNGEEKNSSKKSAEENESIETANKENNYGGPERRMNDRRKNDRREPLQGATWSGKVMNGSVPENKNDDKSEEVEKLTKENESLKDLMMRRQADFENYKKRAMKAQQDYKKFAIRDFALDIITINDDLLRAIDASESLLQNQSLEDSHKSFVEGVTMISKQIEDTLAKYGIKEIEAIDVEFDPNLHEAVEIEMNSDVDCDTVTRVHQKGFILEDLVLRSSKVKVAKAVKESSENETVNQGSTVVNNTTENEGGEGNS